MPTAPSIERKLTTILAADAANFSGRMQRDEVATVQALRRSRDIFERGISDRGGRIANTAGDGLIAEFPSVIEAVTAAIVIQRELEAGKDLLPFRIGLHLGDVIVDGRDLLGDGVNLAARLQDMARQGGILTTQQVVDHAKSRVDAEFRPLGLTRPKHFEEDIPVFAVVAPGVTAPPSVEDVGPWIALDPTRVEPLSPRADKYDKLRKRNYVIIGGFGLLDLVTGAGFGWCLYPIAGFAALQALQWIRLPDADKDALGTMLRAKS